jgi:hypothetical protein
MHKLWRLMACSTKLIDIVTSFSPISYQIRISGSNPFEAMYVNTQGLGLFLPIETRGILRSPIDSSWPGLRRGPSHALLHAHANRLMDHFGYQNFVFSDPRGDRKQRIIPIRNLPFANWFD